ncbi:MAG: hypothetical protein Q4A82_00895 [Corynebacterium sp.]|nr:hypothetical protein [Corynebacterium sp.]
MSDLSVLLGDQREAVAAELAEVADAAINDAGIAVKTTFNTAKLADKNLSTKAANRVLPDLLETLQPRWDAYQASDVTEFGTYLNTNSDGAIEDILAVADANVKKADNSILNKVYDKVRPKAASLMKPHVPLLGDIIEKHMKAAG